MFSGDIGELRANGILKIIDRKKNIFKLSQGEYVAAEHLEKIYGSSPIVEDVSPFPSSFNHQLFCSLCNFLGLFRSGYMGTASGLC